MTHFSILERLFLFFRCFFFFNSLNFFQGTLVFSIWWDRLGAFWLILKCASSRWVQAIKTFLNSLPYIFTRYHGHYHHSCYHIFMGVLYCFQNTTIFNLLLYHLLYGLLYIFSEIVHIYRILISLPRVNIKTFKKEVYYYF